jgi:hypothetical protein
MRHSKLPRACHKKLGLLPAIVENLELAFVAESQTVMRRDLIPMENV